MPHTKGWTLDLILSQGWLEVSTLELQLLLLKLLQLLVLILLKMMTWGVVSRLQLLLLLLLYV